MHMYLRKVVLLLHTNSAHINVEILVEHNIVLKKTTLLNLSVKIQAFDIRSSAILS